MRFSLFHGSSALTTQLILAFLIVSLISLGLLAFLNERDMRAVLTNDANQSLATVAEQTAAGIDAFIRDNWDAVRREALLPSLVRYLSLPVVERVGSSEEEAVVSTLNELRRRDKVFISTYALLDSQGQNLIDTTPENMGRDESGHDYWRKSLETGLPFLSAPRFDRQSENQAASFHEAVLYFSAPVRDGRETIGILRMGYQAPILQQLVVKNHGLAGEQSYAILFDENQIRLAHGRAPELIFKSVVPLSPPLVRTLQAEGRLPNASLEELSTNFPPLADGLDNLVLQAHLTTPLVATG